MKSKTGWGLLAVFGAALWSLAIAGPARAADDKPFSVQAGGTFLPGEDRHDFGDFGFDVGFGYSPGWRSLISKDLGRSSFDFRFNHVDQDGRLDTYGLAYVERVKLMKPKGHSVVPYAGLGVGVFYLDGRIDRDGGGGGATGGGDGGGGKNPKLLPHGKGGGGKGGGGGNGGGGGGRGDESATGIRPGGIFVLGAELPNHLFLEASYVLVGDLLDRRADSVNLNLGLHF